MARPYKNQQKQNSVGNSTPDTSAIKGDGVGFVTVFANLATGHVFNLPGKRTLRINGVPVSSLVTARGESLPAGQYGETYGVREEDWEYVMKTYHSMAMFKNGLVFAEADSNRGQDIADERHELRHGREQFNPEKGVTKPNEEA